MNRFNWRVQLIKSIAAGNDFAETLMMVVKLDPLFDQIEMEYYERLRKEREKEKP